MRTLEEILADVQPAIDLNDKGALSSLVDELQAAGSPLALAHMHHKRGILLYLQKDFEGAISSLDQAFELFKQLHDLNGQAIVERSYGSFYFSMGDNVKALEHHHESARLFEELGNTSAFAKEQYRIGMILKQSSAFPESLEYLHRSKDLYNNATDDKMLSMCLESIGNVQGSMKMFNDALDSLQKALDICERNKWSGRSANVKGNIGVVLQLMGKDNAVIPLFEEVSASYKNVDIEAWRHWQSNLGQGLVRLNRIDEAEAVLNVLKANHTKSDINDYTIDLLESSICIKRADYDKANAILLNRLKLIQSEPRRDLLLRLHERLRDVAQHQQDFTAFVEHTNAFNRISEELHGAEARVRVAMQDKERQIHALTQERERERNVLYSTLPKHIADRVIKGESVTDHHIGSTVLFLDIAGFTTLSSSMSPVALAQMLDSLFAICDAACARHKVTRVKTIGDSYMAAGF